MIDDIKEVMLGEVPVGCMVQMSLRGRWWKVASADKGVYKLLSTHSYHNKIKRSTDKVWISTGNKMTELQQQVLDKKITQGYYSKQLELMKTLQEERDRCKEVVSSIDNLLDTHYKVWVQEYEQTKRVAI